MKKTAIILGATGLTGGVLLKYLLDDSSYDQIKVFGRSSIGFTHPKLQEYLIDMFNLMQQEARFKAAVVFCCIGTTKAKTPNKELYQKIDYGIPVQAAQLAKQNGIETFLVISAMGADPQSKVFYNKVKGKMERDVLAQHIKHTFILQPSLIGGKREEKRLGESLAKFFMSVFGFLIPKKYKIVTPQRIASTMQIVAAKGYETNRITSDIITTIGHG